MSEQEVAEIPLPWVNIRLCLWARASSAVAADRGPDWASHSCSMEKICPHDQNCTLEMRRFLQKKSHLDLQEQGFLVLTEEFPATAMELRRE